jgi:hypothetical protein
MLNFFIQVSDFHDTDPRFNSLTWFDELTNKFFFAFFFLFNKFISFTLVC